MKAIGLNLRWLVFVATFTYFAAPAVAQKKVTAARANRKDFYQLLAEANLKFTYPPGFREIKAINDEDFSFDFAMELPGRDFEMWVQVRSQKENWTSYLHTQHDASTQLANPDSIYLQLSRADAIALTGDNDCQARNMPPEVLQRYNADAGKSYLLNLLDLPATNHYKYALIISLQQNHLGTLVAVCFTNEKDPDFYKNVNRASRCFKFKPVPVSGG